VVTCFADFVNSSQHVLLNLRVLHGYHLALLDEVVRGTLHGRDEDVGALGAAFLLPRLAITVHQSRHLSKNGYQNVVSTLR
jgi:hypothetical protein